MAMENEPFDTLGQVWGRKRHVMEKMHGKIPPRVLKRAKDIYQVYEKKAGAASTGENPMEE